MEIKSVVEFLWGSPIVTDKSDEDWLIFVDNRPKTFIRYTPKLSDLRTRRADIIGRGIKELPDFLYDRPFYNALCLMSKEYFIDATAVPQIEEIVSMREDVARMNLSEFYNTLTQWLNRVSVKVDKRYSPKLASKLVQHYALADIVISRGCFEEALSCAIEAARPIKLETISHAQAVETITHYRERFNRKEVRDFFAKDPNTQTYLKVKSIVDSIDLENLSGIPVKGNL